MDLKAWCQAANLCVRCYLRVSAARPAPATFGATYDELCRLHAYRCPLPEDRACAGCLGVLSDRVLDDVPRQALRALQGVRHDARYKLTATLPPAATLVRERALWVALKRSFPDAQRPRTLRESLKLALSDRLEAAGLRYAAEAPLFLDVALAHPSSSQELAPFCAPHLAKAVAPAGSRGKRPRGSAPSATVAQRVLAAIDDVKFVEVAPPHLVPPAHVDDAASVDVKATVAPVLLAGEYNKYSRVVSQTPWLVQRREEPPKDEERPENANGETNAAAPPRSQPPAADASSVEDVVIVGLRRLLQPERIVFTAGGREDVDVRMLGAGRPFIVELVNPRVVGPLISQTTLRKASDISRQASTAVAVRNLRIATPGFVKEIKVCEAARRKRYRCVVWMEQALPLDTLRARLEVTGGFLLHQKTPLRVLHRRTLATRERWVYSAKVTRLVAPHFFVLDLETQAGTYVKEAVHSDHGRTVPNVGQLIGCNADIIQLDVLGVDSSSN